MSWHTGRLLALDTETTGIDVNHDQIVTASAIYVGGGEGAIPLNWMSNLDGAEIPEAATAVHGITTEHARANGGPAQDVTKDIVTALSEAVAASVPIVGHNVVFDLTLLDREARRHLGCGLDGAFDLARMRVVDTRVLDQHVLPRRRRVSQTQGPRQLITLAQVYGFEWDEKAAHGSEYDALMSARIAYRINQIAQTPHADRPEFVTRDQYQRFDDLAGLDLEQVHAVQVGWAAEQARSLQEYLRRMKPDVRVEQAWPLIPLTDAELEQHGTPEETAS
ncbi:exonuclease domain-containing protein [Streptomyces mirabilis]|uniref:exonuclease domain-containing protein n=1 Tax=Streptomyces mirabilis TaxID=68239 RepID=UPI0033C52408